jgi:Phage integrase, N-terminal SAM-like domain
MSWPMVSPLRQRMIDDIRARKLGRHSLRSHIRSCKRFAAFLKRSPETATADDVRRFQLTLGQTVLHVVSSASPGICGSCPQCMGQSRLFSTERSERYHRRQGPLRGQQRTCRPRNPTSVLPPRPDIADQAGHVGLVPED